MINTERVCDVRIIAVHKSFGKKQILNGFSLDVQKGETVVVLGRSGSGKSVLIKCVIGLYMPDAGTIEVLGEDISTMKQDELDKIRARVGFLFQSNALYDSMTVKQNLEFPMRRHLLTITKEESDERIVEMLTHVGLAHTINMLPSELSGGMQKRIALARTLVLRPNVILYDEPTTGLDPITAREISTLINNTQNRFNTTSIIISHDMKCVSATADRVAILHEGKCYAIDTFENVSTSTDPIIKQFFE